LSTEISRTTNNSHFLFTLIFSFYLLSEKYVTPDSRNLAGLLARIKDKIMTCVIDPPKM
jgi:hypothetical protein